ncbi:hypothetical protein ACQ33O_02535 [Ferruginibacter sp. SUN002]|uniref:hypothetical protein n=1 Tax=Ferruginibacter sp. SUN002 TaxID=2937789 RepID=UPI003D359BB5
MNIQATLFKSLFIFSFSFFTCSLYAQKKKKERKKEFYFSWGYNKEWYTKSKVKIDQPSLGNKYTFVDVIGKDHPGWNEDGGIFKKELTIPQYNYRLGLFLNKKKDLAVEINFDHTKFIFADQRVRIKGTLNNAPVDSLIDFNKANGYYYYLNNGANFLLFNIVKRWHLYKNNAGTFKVDALGKVGIGPVIPHVENSFFGNTNTPHFQIGGWNTGVEAALRTTFFDYVYLEFSNKADYARYADLKIFEGTAKHAFGTYEMILSLGVNFPVGSKVKN